MFLHIVLTRKLGASEYGRFVYALQLVYIASEVLCLGMDHAIVRFLPEFVSKGKGREQNSIVLFSVLVVFVLSLFGVLLFIVGYSLHLIQNQKLIIFGCAAIVVFGSIRLASSVLRGYRAYLSAQLPTELIQPSIFLMSISALSLLLTWQLNADIGMIFLLGSAVTTLLLLIWFVCVHVPRVRPSSIQPVNWLTVAIPLMLGGLILSLDQRIGIFVLNEYLSERDVGIYAISERIGRLTLFLNSAFVFVLGPVISANWFNGNRQPVFQAYWMIGVANCFFAWGFVLVFNLYGEHILALFGREFIAGQSTVAIITTLFAISLIPGPVGILLSMTGYHTNLLIFIGIAVPLSAVLCILLVPYYGIDAAAWATGISQIFWRFSAALFAYLKIVKPKRHKDLRKNEPV